MFSLLLVITVIDLIIPDPLPFLDEIALIFLTALSYQVENKPKRRK